MQVNMFAYLGNTCHRDALWDALWEEGKPTIWAKFCWETSGPAIHVDATLTCSTYTNSVADHVCPVMQIVFPDNVACHKAKMAEKWFEVLTWPPNSPDISQV